MPYIFGPRIVNKCEARSAERIIATIGKLVGRAMTLGRPINVSGDVEIRDNKFLLTPAAEKEAAADRQRSTKEFWAQEAERGRLRSLGVMFVQDQPSED